MDLGEVRGKDFLVSETATYTLHRTSILNTWILSDEIYYLFFIN